MKTANIIFGAAALISASSLAVKAENFLFAGPLPGEYPGQMTCSALNINPFHIVLPVTLELRDANDNPVPFGTKDCGPLLFQHSCEIRAPLRSNASPFHCDITINPGGTAPPGPNIAGSLCGELSDANYCLQALPALPAPGS